MAGKRRSRLDRILPASLDRSPAGGSVTSASPPAPPPDPTRAGPRIRWIPEEFPGAGMQLPPSLPAVPGSHPCLPPVPSSPPGAPLSIHSLFFFFFSCFFPHTPFISKRTISPQIQHRAGKAKLWNGKKNNPERAGGAGSVLLQSAGAPPKSTPAQKPPNHGGGPQLTLRACPRPPAPLSPPATPRHSCPHIWHTKGRVAPELSPPAGSVLVAEDGDRASTTLRPR